MNFKDTYFLNSKEALKIATLQNKKSSGYWLQCCYYDGEKIDSDLVNLIHLPLDHIVEKLILLDTRVPETIDFTGIDIEQALKLRIMIDFYNLIEKATLERKNLFYYSMEELKSKKLDFNDNLRFLLRGHENTQVMQYVSKNISSTLMKMGYEVLYIHEYGTCDTIPMPQICEFNPHVIININHIFNSYLNDNCFNFIWFQDAMPILMNNEPIELRKRDFIFSYSTLFKNLLLKKGVRKKIIFRHDVIPVDEEEFYLDESVTREDKIVFVGGYYPKSRCASFMTEEINDILIQYLEEGKSLSKITIEQLFIKFNIDINEDEAYFNNIQQTYIRNISIGWLCEYDKKKIEVYGYGYDKQNCQNKSILSKHIGIASKDTLNKIYNSAKYALCASGQLINTQRLGEIIHSGAIPVIYDSRDITDEKKTWDDECIYFKTKKELHFILDNNIEPLKYRSKKMLKHFTYNKFIKKIKKTIKKDIKDD